MDTDDTVTYTYSIASLLRENTAGEQVLFLSNYAEVPSGNLPCFFTGTITNPYIVARCLVTLANVVKSNYILTATQLEAM